MCNLSQQNINENTGQIYGTQYMRNSEKSNFETESIFLRRLILSGKKTYIHSYIILERFQTFAAAG
jgi:hypothetical protein